MKGLINIFVLLSVCSCVNHTHSNDESIEKNDGSFFQINYESLLKNKEVLYLSDIASEVEYIPLETNSGCNIGNRPQYFFTDSLILVNNFDHILKFSREGKFLARIGTSGRGPQEIDFIRTMSVLPEKNLIVIQKNSEPKLLYFSFNGSFIKSISVPRFYALKVLKEGNLLGYESGFSGTEKYNFLLTTENGDTLSAVINADTWTGNISRSLDIPHPFEPFYISENQIHFRSLYNDTVYHISSNAISPEYHVNLGKYKLPSELRPPEKVLLDPSKIQTFYKKAVKYFYCNVFESAGTVFLTSANFKDSDIRHFIYNKNAGNGCMLIDKVKESAGIINDWDGGMDFWPVGSFESNKIYMPVSISKIKDVLSESKSDINIDPDKKNKLNELVSRLDDTCNPIIMIVTLK